MEKYEMLINAAKSFKGKKYVWGGESDQEGGYDCSGLFYASMKKMGENISRLSAQGYFNKYATKPTHTVPLPGDVLFFGKDAKHITHMAIAINCITMIESIGSSKNTKSNPGKGVSQSNITRRSDLIRCVDIFNSYSKYYPAYTGSSLKIDVVFGAIGAPYGSVSKRSYTAVINGITGYKGTAAQNLKLIKLAKDGKLRRM